LIYNHFNVIEEIPDKGIKRKIKERATL